jgi:hypothetical protein
VDVLELLRAHYLDADRIEIRQFVRELSESSPSIVSVWLEDQDGGLLYAAADGRPFARWRMPMA